MRRTGSPNPRATTEWLSSCTRTDRYSSTTNAAATTNLVDPCKVAARSLAYTKMKIPAITNQYGET